MIESIENEKNTIVDASLVSNIEKLMHLFHKSTNIGVRLMNENGETLIDMGWQHICSHFHKKHPEARKSCIESEKFFANNVFITEFVEYKCSNGLFDLAKKIDVDSVGSFRLLFGQVLFNDEPVDRQYFEKQAERFGFDVDNYLGSLRQVPVLPREKIYNYVELFSETIRILIETAAK